MLNYDEFISRRLLSITKHDLHASALVYREDNKYNILLRHDLSPSWYYFSILHEIGHIATKTVMTDPRGHQDQAVECAANLWALNILRDNLNKNWFATYEATAKKSSHQLYQLINDRLFSDLVNYY